VVIPDNWEAPSPSLLVQRFVLASVQPAILHIPPGHAFTMQFLTKDALLGVFSSGRIENASKDDWRFDIGKWKLL